MLLMVNICLAILLIYSNGGFGEVRATSSRQGRLAIVAGDLDTLKSRPYFWRINERDNRSLLSCVL